MFLKKMTLNLSWGYRFVFSDNEWNLLGAQQEKKCIESLFIEYSSNKSLMFQDATPSEINSEFFRLWNSITDKHENVSSQALVKSSQSNSFQPLKYFEDYAVKMGCKVYFISFKNSSNITSHFVDIGVPIGVLDLALLSDKQTVDGSELIKAVEVLNESVKVFENLPFRGNCLSDRPSIYGLPRV